MSAPPGRSATVTALSGRVHALKFMQRGSPSTPSKTTSETPATPSTPASPSPAASPAPSVPGSPAAAFGQDEQWSLSPAAIARIRANAKTPTAKAGPVISHEAGFESWLIKRTGAEQPAANQRLTFGKIGKTNTAGTEPEVEADESRAASDEDEQKGERFLKPGSSKRSAQAEGKAAKKQRRRGEDKVPYADNYVPASFLSELRTNSDIARPSVWVLVLASLRVSTALLRVAVFAIVYTHLLSRRVDAELVLGAIVVCAAVGAVVRRGREPVLASVLGKMVVALVLLAVSPVLRTLTEATTSDTIWALAAMLFTAHLVLADYAGGSGKLQDTLSFNAAISASVVLASRLDDDVQSFSRSTAPSLWVGGARWWCG
ncbi:uncharacterized protein PSANT_05275 [Moesziomyces antarcticus]|uniref:Uncharacterized protein n=1 Tax=Pseudozyma antarctica TaxID=84753 RepID=A0A5C3FVI7_PSEA2|nr:uncharacterized protein PSANT_05275 [Moesziomyces antarcticus]